jgi:hypothetical protein
MLDVTGWAVAVWLKWTLVLAAAVGIAWLVLPAGSGWFWAITATAGVIEIYVSRQLAREWLYQAHYSWWWAR